MIGDTETIWLGGKRLKFICCRPLVQALFEVFGESWAMTVGGLIRWSVGDCRNIDDLTVLHSSK